MIVMTPETHTNNGSLMLDSKAEAKREFIIGKILQWSVDHGEPPKVNDWRHVRGTEWPSYLTVIRAFGSWDAGIEAAGYQPRGRGRPVEV